MSDKNAQMTFVCRENIKRYERILATHLTDLERDFIKKRIAEEMRALGSAAGGGFKLYQAPKAVVAIFASNFVDLSLPFNIVEQVALFWVARAARLQMIEKMMTSDVASQIPRRTKIGFLRLLGGILALAAEATVMAVLMVMAGICALGSLIGVLIVKGNNRT